MKGVYMNLGKKLKAKIILLFRSFAVHRAKKRLTFAFKSYPQSIRKLSLAYEEFLKAVKREQRALVSLKALNNRYSSKPILMKIRDIGKYTVSRKAKEILSETGIVCAKAYLRRLGRYFP